MESEDLLRYYFNEVKDTQQDINNLVEVEEHIQNEAEEATDFLVKAGLNHLHQLYTQGKEISENAVVASVRASHLTEKQAQTVRSRVATLNKTLRSRQPRRKQRQDVRDVAWNVETSSTGSRSRSATPDSLDSDDIPDAHAHEDLTSDDEHQLSSLPPFPLESPRVSKTKVKLTTSEPLQGKKVTRYDYKGAIANLDSDTVVLKGYQPLAESSTPPVLRERSDSDPMPEPMQTQHSQDYTPNFHVQLRRSNNRSTPDYLECNNEKESISFQGLIKQGENSNKCESTIERPDRIYVEDLSDSEYQYLKPLLYVELVAIFDQYKILYHKKKASTKSKGGNVFGVNLSTLLMRDMPSDENTMVPQIFQLILKELNDRCVTEDGILRLAGQKQKLESICCEIESQYYNQRNHTEHLLSQATAHDLTGILKKLIRDLPDPIFTMELFDMFYKIDSIPKGEDKVRALNLLVLMLPIEHRNTFRAVLNFLLKIIENEQKNRMGLQNVAMISAPSFFPPKLMMPKDTRKFFDKHTPREDLTQQITNAAACCRIVELILTTGNKLFSVPQYLAAQAQKAQHEAQLRKDKGKERKFVKTKLVRSSTQYESGVKNLPRVKKSYYQLVNM